MKIQRISVETRFKKDQFLANKNTNVINFASAGKALKVSKKDTPIVFNSLIKKIGLLIGAASLTLGGAVGGTIVSNQITCKKIDAQTELIEQVMKKNDINSKKLELIEGQNAKLTKENNLNQKKLEKFKKENGLMDALTRQQAAREANSLIKNTTTLSQINKEIEQKKNILVEAGISAKDLKKLEEVINEQCKNINDPFLKAAKTDNAWQKTIDYLMSQELVEDAYNQGKQEAYKDGIQEMSGSKNAQKGLESL